MYYNGNYRIKVFRQLVRGREKSVQFWEEEAILKSSLRYLRQNWKIYLEKNIIIKVIVVSSGEEKPNLF